LIGILSFRHSRPISNVSLSSRRYACRHSLWSYDRNLEQGASHEVQCEKVLVDVQMNTDIIGNLLVYQAATAALKSSATLFKGRHCNQGSFIQTLLIAEATACATGVALSRAT